MRYAKLIITFFLPVIALVTMSSCAHEQRVAATAVVPAGPAVVPVDDTAIVKQPVGEPVAGANPEVVAPGAEAAAVPAAATPKLGDEEILEVAHEANAAEIEQAKLAEKRAKDPRVRQFAKMMDRMHTDADRRGDRAATAAGLQPAASAVSDKLHTDAKTTYVTISGKKGTALDVAYISAQIEEHGAVLKMIDEQLLPGATDAHVKALVQAMRPVVAQHLEQALSMQTTLKDK